MYACKQHRLILYILDHEAFATFKRNCRDAVFSFFPLLLSQTLHKAVLIFTLLLITFQVFSTSTKCVSRTKTHSHEEGEEGTFLTFTKKKITCMSGHLAYVVLLISYKYEHQICAPTKQNCKKVICFVFYYF